MLEVVAHRNGKTALTAQHDLPLFPAVERDPRTPRLQVASNHQPIAAVVPWPDKQHDVFIADLPSPAMKQIGSTASGMFHQYPRRHPQLALGSRLQFAHLVNGHNLHVLVDVPARHRLFARVLETQGPPLAMAPGSPR